MEDARDVGEVAGTVPGPAASSTGAAPTERSCSPTRPIRAVFLGLGIQAGVGFLGALGPILGAIAAALVGPSATRASSRSPRAWRHDLLKFSGVILGLLLLAALLFAVGVGSFRAVAGGALFGVVGGVILASAALIILLLFMPISALSRLTGRIGRARERTIVDASDRRLVWTVSAALIALAALTRWAWRIPDWTAIRVPLELPVANGILGGAVLAVAGLAVCDVVAYPRLASLARQIIAMRLHDAEATGGKPRVLVADLGFGNEEWEEEATSSGGPYRESGEVRAIRGNPRQALRAIRGNVYLGIAALATSVASAALALR